MEWDDIIYISLLIFSIGFGHIVRKINHLELKKWICTIVGLLIAYLVSGLHILHPLITTLVGILLIKLGDKRRIHLTTFGFFFTYLLFFRSTHFLGIPNAPGHTNLIQMMLTLKLVGLAFEIHDSYMTKKSKGSGDSAIQEDNAAQDVNPGYLDIFHYSFTYVGVLTGPYYRFRTFWDWLHCPFTEFAPCIDATIGKLKYVPLYAGLFLLASYMFPIQYMEAEEFYTERSVIYRIWYFTPTFFIFRMRIYTGLVMSECVCTMAGLGAYPVATAPRSGEGPTKEYEALKVISSNKERARKEIYNFETIHNIDPYGSDFCTTFRSAMKCWNSCIQYWLAVYIYKRLSYKQIRTLITMFVSAFWHGVYAGYYLCLCSAPLYLPVEDLYVKLFRKDATGVCAQIWDWIIWFFKMQAFAYMASAFLLLHVNRTLYYWKSIYFIGHIIGISLYLIGICIAQTRKVKGKSKEQ